MEMPDIVLEQPIDSGAVTGRNDEELQQKKQREEEEPAAKEIRELKDEEEAEWEQKQREWRKKFNDYIKEFRGWMSTVAALIASFTYQAGLNPPGGFWGDDDKATGKIAGTSILLHKSPARYYAFSCGNALAFASSLYVIFWLGLHSQPQDDGDDDDRPLLRSTLFLALLLGILGFSVAYTAGSSTSRPFSACVAVVLALALASPAARLAVPALCWPCRCRRLYIRCRWW